ncbi:MAG: fused DSP-PTPase phosphatase/NAD kinase-like protein [bacterium]
MESTMLCGVPHWPLREPVEGAYLPPWPERFRQTPPPRNRQLWELWGVDHGFLRAISPNLHRLSEKMYRSSQPAPYQIARLARRGIRTIVNLRGQRDCGSYYLELEACRKHGIELVNFRVKSREAPDRDTVYGARALFEQIEYPAVMHCKSGADRAGIASVLYLFLHEGRPMEEARRQLSWRYGHIRQSKTGVLDYFVERYLADRNATGIGFWDWVDTRLDPAQFREDFKSRKWADVITDDILDRE